MKWISCKERFPKEDQDSKKPHPWGVFLNARYYAILWMKDEQNYSDEVIAKKLSMDPTQVYLIRTSSHIPIPDGSGNKTSEFWKRFPDDDTPEQQEADYNELMELLKDNPITFREFDEDDLKDHE